MNQSYFDPLYMAPSLLSICIFCLLSFFWETFFFSGSWEALVLAKACSFSTRVSSMWQGELMYGLMRPWALNRKREGSVSDLKVEMHPGRTYLHYFKETVVKALTMSSAI